MVDKCVPYVWTQHKSRSAMAVDVVRAALWIVFDHKDSGRAPEGAMRDVLEHFAQDVVVLRHHSLRCQNPRPSPQGVVAGQRNHLEGRHGTYAHELLKLSMPDGISL